MQSRNEALASHSQIDRAGIGGRFWLVAGLMLATFAWVVGWYFKTAADMAAIWWKSDTFAHGLVVLPIFAWLVWQKRELIARNTPEPAVSLIGAVFLAGLAWLIGEIVSAAAISHTALVSMLVAAFVAVLGWRLSRVLLFPLLFLFFGVPVGEFLLPVLMAHTADFTVIALRATGVPVYQEGLHFIVPNGRWSVVEACSGLRYLIASLMVGSLYAYINYVSLKRRLLFMLVALAVPIVANWIRAYITVMVGYHFGSEFVNGFIHIVYGWVFFGIVIFLMFLIGARWREEAPKAPAVADAGEIDQAAAGKARWWPLAPLAVCVAMFPLIAASLNAPVEPFAVGLRAPSAAGGWQAVEERATHDFRPSFHGHRGDVFQTYRRDDGAELGLYFAYYAEQREGYELVMFGNSLNGRQESGWVRTASANAKLSIGEVRHAGLRRGNDVLSLWSWYWINDRIVTNDYLAKLFLAIDRLTGWKDDSAVIVITVKNEAGAGDAREMIEDFLAHHWTALQTQLHDLEERR